MEISRRKFIMLTAATAGTIMAPAAWAQGNVSTLDTIIEKGRLNIGVTEAPPWFSKNPMTGKWSGVGIMLGQRLADDLGVKMNMVETTWQNAVSALLANQIDVMFILDPTPERRKAIDFPKEPLFYYALGVLVEQNSHAKTWEDLNKPTTKIAVTMGTSFAATVTKKLPRASILRFANNDEAVAAFASGRANAVAQYAPALTVQYARLKMGKVIIPTPVHPIPTSAGIRKGSPAFSAWLSDKFRQYKAAHLPEKFFDDYLKSVHVNPAKVPNVIMSS